MHCQRPAQLDALLHAVGQQGHRVLAPLLDLEEVDDVLDGEAVLHLLAPRRTEPQGTRQPRPLHADVATQQQVLEHGHLREQLDVLEGAGDAEFGHPVGAGAHQALALPTDVALLGAVHLADRVEYRGLAGAVGADHGEEFLLAHGERNVVNRLDPLEGEADVIDLEQYFAHDSHLSRRRSAPLTTATASCACSA